MAKMNREQILNDFNKSKRLFTIPQVLSEILEIMKSDEASVKEIAEVIKQDPSLTVKILKIANSTFYRRSEEISTVNQAVLVLGANTIKSLALSVSVLSLSKFQNDAKNLFRDPKLYWKHSLETGISARFIALACNHPEPDEALVAGLLHDLGIMFLETKYPREYETVIKKIKEGEDIIRAESTVFDLNHCELGAMLGKKWDIPSRFIRCIEYHHHPENDTIPKDIDKLVLITSLANNLTRYDIESSNENLEKKLHNVKAMSKALGIPREKLDEVRIRTSEEIVESASYFDIDVGDTNELLNKANSELCEFYLMLENLFRERQELSRKLLEEERHSGAIESLNIVVSTLAHYINNTTMAISGRSQLLEMLLNNGQLTDTEDKLRKSLEIIDHSVIKIGATLEELRKLTSLKNAQYFSESNALDIETQLKKRIEAIVEKKISEVAAT